MKTRRHSGRKNYQPRLLLAVAAAVAAPLAAGPRAAFGDLDITYGSIGGEQNIFMPVSASYVITAYGAQGGNSQFANGGLGATVTGGISLSAGEALQLFVGTAGTSGNVGIGADDGGEGGGGGGTFVYRSSTGALVLAAGGGGGAASFAGGGNGQSTDNGQAGGGQDGGAGGTSE